jgi:uncharacterized membrane protein YidH (DUF202 family)
MRILAIILIVVGALALGYGGFSYISHDKVVDAGPIQVSADREHNVFIPPVVGVIAVVAGLVLLVSGKRDV